MHVLTVYAKRKVTISRSRLARQHPAGRATLRITDKKEEKHFQDHIWTRDVALSQYKFSLWKRKALERNSLLLLNDVWVCVGQSYPCSKQCLSLSTARAAEANSRRTGSSNMSPINFLKQKPMGVPRNTWVVSHLWETKNEAGHELQGFFF